MRRLSKIISALVIIGVMGSSMTLTAFAAKASITSISIRVGTDVEAGDYLPDRPSYTNDNTDSETGTYASASSNKYTIDDVAWSSSSASERELGIGDEPKMVITLQSSYYTVGEKEYLFRGSYSSSNVSIKGGTFVSARIKDSGDVLEVTVKLKGVKGDYISPDVAEWKNAGYGRASWSYDSDNKKLTSGYYDVYLYRGNSIVKKLEEYQGTSYNFFPYMTKAGTYSYKIRAVPHTEAQKKYGRKSDWGTSDEVYVGKEYVSDGSGQTDSTTGAGSSEQVGWIQTNGTWYFRYPDGSYLKNSWDKINGKWYLFDEGGKMVTGWKTRNNQTYFLQDAGDMLTGWIKSGEKWYYLNPTEGDFEGAMCRGWIQVGDLVYFMDSTGAMAEGWTKVDDNWYYFYPGSGQKALNTHIDSFYVDNNGIWRK